MPKILWNAGRILLPSTYCGSFKKTHHNSQSFVSFSFIYQECFSIDKMRGFNRRSFNPNFYFKSIDFKVLSYQHKHPPIIYFWIMPILTVLFNTKQKLYWPHRILQVSPVSFRNAEEKHWLKVFCSLQNSIKVLYSIEISKTNCFLFVKRKRKKWSTSDSNSYFKV